MLYNREYKTHKSFQFQCMVYFIFYNIDLLCIKGLCNVFAIKKINRFVNDTHFGLIEGTIRDLIFFRLKNGMKDN